MKKYFILLISIGTFIFISTASASKTLSCSDFNGTWHGAPVPPFDEVTLQFDNYIDNRVGLWPMYFKNSIFSGGIASWLDGTCQPQPDGSLTADFSAYVPLFHGLANFHVHLISTSSLNVKADIASFGSMSGTLAKQ